MGGRFLAVIPEDDINTPEKQDKCHSAKKYRGMSI
jgi:hypothetical protein